MTELKPCPFCGGEAFLSGSPERCCFYVTCFACGASGPIETYLNQKEKGEAICRAIDLWNGVAGDDIKRQTGD